MFLGGQQPQVLLLCCSSGVVYSLSAGFQYCRGKGGTGWHTACFSMPVRSNIKLGDIYMQLLFEKLSRRPCHCLQMRYVGIVHSLLKGRSQNAL